MNVRVKVAQSCPTLCDPGDCTVHGILQARILEWVAMPSSRGSSQPRDLTHVYYLSCIGRWVFYQYSYLTMQSYYNVIDYIHYVVQPIPVTFIS